MSVHCSVIYGSQSMEAAWVPVDTKWIERMWCIHTTACHSAVKKEILPFAVTRRDFEGIMPEE